MKENLMKLLNTLRLVETKGESTKIMAQCLQFTEMMIVECDKPDAPAAPAADPS
jgi:hypothetical protein